MEKIKVLYDLLTSLQQICTSIVNMEEQYTLNLGVSKYFIDTCYSGMMAEYPSFDEYKKLFVSVLQKKTADAHEVISSMNSFCQFLTAGLKSDDILPDDYSFLLEVWFGEVLSDKEGKEIHGIDALQELFTVLSQTKIKLSVNNINAEVRRSFPSTKTNNKK